MYMAYTTNPKLPKLRKQLANLVIKDGWSSYKVARYSGYNHSTILRWVQKSKESNLRTIPTLSSKPFHHPRELSQEVKDKIIEYRYQYRRCAEVIHHFLIRDGYKVSLSSVERTLKRNNLVYHSKWKKWHQYPERPIPEKPGILIQIDTIFEELSSNRLYIYTLIDLFSRWAYALPELNISTHRSLFFVKQAQIIAPFKFSTLQLDYGSEFSKWFTKRIIENGFSHRHSRVRTPSDNGHLERFNRTIQDECLSHVPRNLKSYQKEISNYLHYYNYERPHMALAMKTPMEMLNLK
jgi:transposase InsO family protein